MKNVKKKALLFGSVAAMLLTSALLMTPANAQGILRHCTSSTAVTSAGTKVTSKCQVAPIDACFCPLSGTIISNNCQFVGAKR